jgi:transposase-like protein
MVSSAACSSTAPAGYRFPREVIAVAVRWYLRYSLSYRDVEELLAERGSSSLSMVGPSSVGA